jgi:Protein of unknown function (DUF3307)
MVTDHSERHAMGDVFALVLAGHVLGDFVAQTDWQASNKERSWRADLEHVVTYHVILGLLVLPAWHDWRALVFLGISATTHGFLDRRWPTRRLLDFTWSTNFATTFWGMIATDQALHLSILAVSFYWLSH